MSRSSLEHTRPFRFWEQICSTMNISIAFELQGPVTEDLVLRAWSLVKKEFPYFSSSVIQDESGQLLFRTPPSQQVICSPAKKTGFGQRNSQL